MSSQSLETTLRIRKLILQARDNDPEICIMDKDVNHNVQLVLERLGEDAFRMPEDILRQRITQ